MWPCVCRDDREEIGYGQCGPCGNERVYIKEMVKKRAERMGIYDPAHSRAARRIGSGKDMGCMVCPRRGMREHTVAGCDAGDRVWMWWMWVLCIWGSKVMG